MKSQLRRLAARSAVGERLRTFRLERELTLSDMASRSGVSISNLSKIERGEVSPSFDVIIRICEGLDIALEQFVKPGPKEAISGRKTATRIGEGVPFAGAQYFYLAHATELSRKAMVPLEMWVRARSAADFDHWSRHHGEEYVYVISGAIEIHTEHYAPFPLGAGESAYFDSAMKHVYVSIGEGDAHILSVSHGAVAASQVTEFMNPDVEALPKGAAPRGEDRRRDDGPSRPLPLAHQEANAPPRRGEARAKARRARPK